MDVVTFGETMVLFQPMKTAPLRYVSNYEQLIGGAESNLAIGLAKLGHKVGWFSRLGNDEFGHFILSRIRSEGVDTSRVKFDPINPTAVFFKEKRTEKDIRVYYYRSGSAASKLNPEDIDEDYIASAKILHLSGITPALSDTAYETVFKAIEIAKKHRIKISFDPNLRLKLWSADKARETIFQIAEQADILFPGIHEGEFLTGEKEPRKIAEKIYRPGQQLLIKMGEQGTYYTNGKEEEVIPAFKVNRVIDPVGAGDGFAAGFLSGYLKGMHWSESIKIGNAIGAMVVMVDGDIEGLPSYEDIKKFMHVSGEDVSR